jgi:hypothetical protein
VTREQGLPCFLGMAGSKEDGEAVSEERKTVLMEEVEIFDGTPLLFFHLRVPPCQV